MFGLINRDQLTGAVGSEFEHLMAGLKNFLLVAHNEDGTIIAEPPGTDGVPTGALMAWSTATAPAHWVLCDGRQLNRVDYKRLFDVIGTTYGVGDGSTTFNVPDTRGRFPLSQAAAGTGAVLGATGGALDHTHTAGDHTHTIGASGTHTHGFSGSTGAALVAQSYDRNLDGITGLAPTSSSGYNFSGTTDAGGDHAHGGVTGSAGASTTGANNPAYIVVQTIIKD